MTGLNDKDPETIWVLPHGYEESQLKTLAATLSMMPGNNILQPWVRRGKTGEPDWIAVRTNNAGLLRFSLERQGYVRKVHDSEPDTQG